MSILEIPPDLENVGLNQEVMLPTDTQVMVVL